MRLFFTLLLLQIFVFGNAQTNCQPTPFYAPSCPVEAPKKTVTTADGIKINYTATAAITSSTAHKQPLYVIDGLPYEHEEIVDLNPDDITSIEVLKDATTATFRCRPPRNIILLTTKSGLKKRFIVKDIADEKIIAGATVSLIEKGNLVATGVVDSKGMFTTKKLKRGVEYELIVSAAGYKSFHQSFKNTFLSEQQLFLESNKKKDKVVVLSCRYTNSSSSPFFVIDGVPVGDLDLKKLHPNDIVSIEVLKGAEAIAVYGSHGLRGVILIKTKGAKRFIIRDMADSVVIPGATISFIDKDNQIHGAADGNGAFTTDKLKQGAQYKMIISSVGYKTIETSFTNTYGEQQVFLEREIEEGQHVVIVSYINKRRRGCPIYHEYKEPDSIPVFKIVEAVPVKSIYPNPVQRSNVFNLEFNSEKDETLQLSVVGFDGKTVMMQQQKVVAGFNRISVVTDSRWTAAVYFVLLKNKKGNVIKQDKLIVQ